jgi:hypothetical protein
LDVVGAQPGEALTPQQSNTDQQMSFLSR